MNIGCWIYWKLFYENLYHLDFDICPWLINKTKQIKSKLINKLLTLSTIVSILFPYCCVDIFFPNLFNAVLILDEKKRWKKIGNLSNLIIRITGLKLQKYFWKKFARFININSHEIHILYCFFPFAGLYHRASCEKYLRHNKA